MSNKHSVRAANRKPAKAITDRVMRLNLDAAYQEGLTVIAVAAFRRAFKETLQYAARISPENSLNAVTADYLRAMRSQLEVAASQRATLTERWP
jgi:citrate lyase synthetase